MTVEITTVADDMIVAHDGTTVERLIDLSPNTEYEVGGRTVTTLPRPDGELLCRFATVNDVHFGETEAGRVDDHLDGPIMRVPDGRTAVPGDDEPGAVEEMSACRPRRRDRQG